MSIKLDLGKMKHLKSDDKSTTLRHPAGHTVTIFHNVLSPENQSIIKALRGAAPEKESYGKVIQKADGGQVPVPTSAHDSASSDREQNLKEASTVEKQPTSQSQAATASSPSQMWENVKNGWAEGGEIKYNNPKLAEKGEASMKAKHPLMTPEMQRKHKTQDEFMKNTAGKPMQVTMKARGGYAESKPYVGMSGGSEANYAYDAGLPCLNPHCKSHGAPHPNCRCYSSGEHFAEGGEVSKLRYCAQGMEHQDGCEYAKGGRVSDREVTQQRGELKESEGSLVGTNENYHKTGRNTPIGKMNRENSARELRQSPRPLKGLAEGGDPRDARPVPPSLNMDADKSAIDKLIDMKHAETQSPQDHQVSQNDDHYGHMDQASQGNTQDMEPAPPVQGAAQQMQSPQADPNAATPSLAGQPAAPTQDMDPHSPAPLSTAQPGTQIPQTAMAQPPADTGISQDLAARHIAENQAFQQDLNNGHITPKTYNDLMNYNKDGSEKSTLGKIGSIFGLLLSGAGSGLAHQQNMAMQMMDNTIKNDLEAQIKSKDNAQNFVKINQARLLNDANVKNALASANYTGEQKAAIRQGIQMKAVTQGYMDMSSAAVHKIIDQIKTMPDGPAKQQAVQLAMQMAQAAEKNNAAAAVMGAAGVNGLGGMYGINSGQPDKLTDEQQFQNAMQARENGGDKAGADALRAKHIIGVPGFATDAIPQQSRDKFNNRAILDDKVRDVLDYAQKNKGSIDPKVLTVAAQKAHELTKFYNASTDNLGMTQGRLNWLDEQIKKNPTSFIQQLLGNQKRLAEIRDSNTHQKDIELKNLGFPVNPGPPGSSSSKVPPEGTTGIHGQGKDSFPVIVKNGKWTKR